jgi:hypothetical protein
MSIHSNVNVGEWNLPLCSRYALLILSRLDTQALDEAGRAANHTIRWALGVVPNGEFEVSGTWPELPDQDVVWRRMFGELRSRGVEQVALVVASELTSIEKVIGEFYPRTHLVPSEWSMSRGAGGRGPQTTTGSLALGVGVARRARRAEALARDIGRQASTYLARTGAAIDRDDAAERARAALSRSYVRATARKVSTDHSRRIPSAA